MKNAFCLILCLLVFTMCEKPPKALLSELVCADSLMQRYPDSALVILDSMDTPSPNDKLQYATWCLLITQARDKNYVRHTSDSLINIALDYFERENDLVRKATTLYYEGRVNHDMNKAEEATNFYLRARDVAKETKDYKLLYLINSQLGALYLYRNLSDLALDAYQIAYEYTLQLNDSLLISYSLSYLARIYAIDKNFDKSLFYYKKALSIAEESKSLMALSCSLNEISAIYNELNLLDSSIFYAKKAFDLMENNQYVSLPQVCLGLGHTYELLGEYDLSKFYLKKAIEDGNIYTISSAYQILYDLNKITGKYEDAIKCNDQYWFYRDSIDKINRSIKVAEIQVKYNQEKLLNINNQLLIEKARVEKFGLYILLVLLLLIGGLIYIFQRKLLQKKRAIQTTKEQLQNHLIKLHENESFIRKNELQIHTLSSQLEENSDLQDSLNEQVLEIAQIQQKNESLQNQNKKLQENIEKYTQSLFARSSEMKAYEQLADENSILQDRERFLCNQLIKRIDVLNRLKQSPKCITDVQWGEITEAVDLLYMNLTDRLHKQFLSLTENDLQICCLIKLRLSNSVIATLTGISSSSVTKRKQRLRERINQHLESPLDKEISVETYLWEY